MNKKRILQFKDAENWENIRCEDVRKSYFIPKNISNDICVDIGGNIGAFSLVNNKKFKKILAFEPSTYAFKKYKKNLKIHKISNVKVYQLAVYNKSNKILQLKNWLKRNESGNASTIDSNDWNSKVYEEVKSISLEDIFLKNKLTRINYLKIDCEGAEYEFLMNKNLSNIDYISIEIHNQLEKKAEELFNYLSVNFFLIKSNRSGRLKHFIGTFKNKFLEHSESDKK